jgi:uroporphyrinogen-III synthase
MTLAEKPLQSRGLVGLRVLSLESRRAAEMAKLIANYGGEAILAPSMKEIPLESNSEALAFARSLANGEVDMVIFLTGVGTRALVRVVETAYPSEEFVAALRRVVVVARGPKPVVALKELGVTAALTVPEPNTWRELLQALDERGDSLPLRGRRVAVQEYGATNAQLLSGLRRRGAQVIRVPIYQWGLPDDVGPLRAAVLATTQRKIDVILFTTSIQVTYLLRTAVEMNLQESLHQALSQIVVGSIGPMTSEQLRENGLTVDFEPAHPKMGSLVNEAANRGAELLRQKRIHLPK